MKLSDSALKKYHNKVHDKPFEVADRDSISARVSAKGKITWQFRYRYNKKAERLTLGHYPYLSLSDVRKLAPRLQGILFEGKKPKQEWQKQKSRQQNKAGFTLIRLVEHWFEAVAETQFKGTTYNNYESTIRKWIKNTPKNDGALKIIWVK